MSTASFRASILSSITLLTHVYRQMRLPLRGQSVSVVGRVHRGATGQRHGACLSPSSLGWRPSRVWRRNSTPASACESKLSHKLSCGFLEGVLRKPDLTIVCKSARDTSHLDPLTHAFEFVGISHNTIQILPVPALHAHRAVNIGISFSYAAPRLPASLALSDPDPIRCGLLEKAAHHSTSFSACDVMVLLFQLPSHFVFALTLDPTCGPQI